MLEYVKEYLKINEVEYKENFKLCNASPIKIGGAAELAAYPESESVFLGLVSFLEETGCRYKVLGRMSNVLFCDSGFYGVVILTDKLKDVIISDETLFCAAGVGLPQISRIVSECGISGFEELSGIPGTVGASVLGNAGAFGREISDVLTSVKVFFPKCGEVEVLPSREINFGYRESSLKKHDCLVLSCVFKGKRLSNEIVKSRNAHFLAKRRELQPYDKPSLGSTFKRPSYGVSAGALIDSCGLKGCSVGGAMISRKHAGFIVNNGGASATDYLAVAETAEKAVFAKFGVALEKEIEIIV